jgi:hypothetical protein
MPAARIVPALDEFENCKRSFVLRFEPASLEQLAFQGRVNFSRVPNGVQTPNHIAGLCLARWEADILGSKSSAI